MIVIGVISLGVLGFMVLSNKLLDGEGAKEQVLLPAEEAVQAA